MRDFSCLFSVVLCSVLALVVLGLGCSDPLGCLSDLDCPAEAYCKDTQCIEPVSDGTSEEIYRAAILPILETGCGCHGPRSGRPWWFVGADASEADRQASFMATRAWAYDPKLSLTGGAPQTRPALMGYAGGGCGLAHPSVYAVTNEGQYIQLQRWLTESLSADESMQTSLAVNGPPPSLQALTPIDQKALADIESQPYEEVLKTHIEPRLVAHCGCCHDARGTPFADGGRLWRLNTSVPRHGFIYGKY